MVMLPPDDYRDDAMPTTAANNALALNVTVAGNVKATASDGNIWLTGVRNIKDDIEVTVDAADGTVTLPGHVRSWLEHGTAINSAWMGTGVSAVRDDLWSTGLSYRAPPGLTRLTRRPPAPGLLAASHRSRPPGGSR